MALFLSVFQSVTVMGVTQVCCICGVKFPVRRLGHRLIFVINCVFRLETPAAFALCNNAGVSFIVSPSAAAVSHRKRAFAELSRDSCGAQDSGKRNTLYSYLNVIALLRTRVSGEGQGIPVFFSQWHLDENQLAGDAWPVICSIQGVNFMTHRKAQRQR